MFRLRWIFTGLALALALPFPAPARAQSAAVVDVSGSSALLLRPAKPRGSVILMAGGDGRLSLDPSGQPLTLRGNSLVRTREAFLRGGYATLVVDAGIDVPSAVEFMAKIKRPVILAGTSRGTQRAARGIARGARPDRLVLTSGFLSDESGDYDNVMRIVGDPARLPPTLVVHHRQDGCRKTLPAGVAPFLAWAGPRARVHWIDGGSSSGDLCGAQAHHGFVGVEGQMVSAVLSGR